MPTYTPPPTPMTYKAPEQANIGAGIAQLGSQLQQAGTELKRVYDKEQFKQVRAQSIAKLKEQFGAKFQLPLGEQYITPEQFATGMKNLTRGLATYETVKAKSPNRVLPDPGDFATIMFNGSDQDANKVISSLDAMLGEEDKAARDKIASETNAAALAKLGGGTQEERYNKMATSSEVTNTPEKQNEFYAKGAMSEKDMEANRIKEAGIAQRREDSTNRARAAMARISADKKRSIVAAIKTSIDAIKGTGNTSPQRAKIRQDALDNIAYGNKLNADPKTLGAGDQYIATGEGIIAGLDTEESTADNTLKNSLMANYLSALESEAGIAPTIAGAPKPIKAGKGKEEWITLPSGKRVKKIK